MGECFLVGGNSLSNSNAGAVKSRQEIVIDEADITLSDENFYNRRYKDYTISAVNIEKTIILVNSSISSGASYTYTPCARFINSNTIRVYCSNSNVEKIYATYIQIVEFY